MLVTELTSHRDMSTLNCAFPENKSSMFVTRDTSQSGMSTIPAGPQSAPHSEQHLSPEDTAWMQLFTALTSAALSGNGGLLQTAVSISTPSLHVLVPTRTNSPAHVGVQDEWSASDAVQSPKPPFSTAAEASHGAPMHSAGVSTLSVHDVTPCSVYPSLHVGTQDVPLARVSVQSPTPPLRGGVDASHASSLRTHAAGGPSVEPVDDA